MNTQRRQTSQNARNRRFTIVAAVSLVCALIAGVLALTLPALAQTDSDGSEEENDQDQPAAEKGTIEEAVTERLNAALEPLVTAGTITAEQRDAVVEALLAARRSAPSEGFKWQHGRLDAEARAACVAAIEAHITARVNGDQPGDEADLSVCRGDESGSADHRSHRWSADDRASHRGHVDWGASRSRTGSWSPPPAAA